MLHQGGPNLIQHPEKKKSEGIWHMKMEERQHEDGGRDGSDMTTAKEYLEPPEARRGRKEPPLEPRERVRPCARLDFRLPASRPVTEHISLVLSHLVCGPGTLCISTLG
jgi:hypothetical protein